MNFNYEPTATSQHSINSTYSAQFGTDDASVRGNQPSSSNKWCHITPQHVEIFSHLQDKSNIPQYCLDLVNELEEVCVC